MARNNIKLLSQAQLEKLNVKYSFYIEGDMIVVSCSGYNRSTLHPKDKPFHINSRKYVKRKICFNLDAIEIWLKLVEEKCKYSLFDVQQAVNTLAITYQQVNYDNVKKFLSKPKLKIQSVKEN